MKFFGGRGQRRAMRQIAVEEKESPQVDPGSFEPKQPEKGECKCDRFKTIDKNPIKGQPNIKLVECRNCLAISIIYNKIFPWGSERSTTHD
jgi:hypothetical protein